jgi:hypothetical protein
MLSKLNNYKYNNICNKFIKILNTIKPNFEKKFNVLCQYRSPKIK